MNINNAIYLSALRGNNVVVVARCFEHAENAFWSMRNHLDEQGLPYEARNYDKRVMLPNGCWIRFEKQCRDGFKGEVFYL